METGVKKAEEICRIRSSIAARESEFSFLLSFIVRDIYQSYKINIWTYFLLCVLDRRLRHQHGRGPCNIFILDTSSSLGEEGFKQMKEAFTDIIDGT